MENPILYFLELGRTVPVCGGGGRDMAAGRRLGPGLLISPDGGTSNKTHMSHTIWNFLLNFTNSTFAFDSTFQPNLKQKQSVSSKYFVVLIELFICFICLRLKQSDKN